MAASDKDASPVVAYGITALPIIPIAVLFLIHEATHDLPTFLNPYCLAPIAVLGWGSLAPRGWMVPLLLLAIAVGLAGVPVPACGPSMSCAAPLAPSLAAFVGVLAVPAAIGALLARAAQIVRRRRIRDPPSETPTGA